MADWKVRNGAVVLVKDRSNYQLVIGKSIEHIRRGNKSGEQVRGGSDSTKRRTIHALTGSAEAVLRPNGEIVYLEGDITVKVEQSEATRKRTLVSVDGDYRRVSSGTGSQRVVKDEEFVF